MTTEQTGFTMDGYTDWEAVAADCLETGWSRLDQAQAEAFVAHVCQKLMERLNEHESFDRQGTELLIAVAGIVSCAEREGVV